MISGWCESGAKPGWGEVLLPRLYSWGGREGCHWEGWWGTGRACEQQVWGRERAPAGGCSIVLFATVPRARMPLVEIGGQEELELK